MTGPRLALVGLIAWATCASGQVASRDPRIGYLYPAGGRHGSVVAVHAGGQFLKEASQVWVSGTGVTARVVQWVPPLRGGKSVAKYLKRQLLPAWRDGAPEPSPAPSAPSSAVATAAPPAPAASPADEEMEMSSMMAHPLIQGLSNLTREELRYVAKDLRDGKKRQRNQQIAETVLLEVSIDATAAPGPRELRLTTPAGPTNALWFEVGISPEIAEHEPNNPDWPEIRKVELPAVLNGQILPGDVDCFRFDARAGQRLAIDVRARRLIPYLADAVPGWFQATAALLDAAGDEIAFADDCGFDPDPLLLVEIPADGEYRLQIRDALYRGRQDFVYRVTVGERALPLAPGAPPSSGWEALARAHAWKRPWEHIPYEVLRGPGSVPDDVLPDDSDLPVVAAREAGDCAAQPIELPVVVTGVIGVPGDEDAYAFSGRAGQQVVARVHARSRRSPLDSLVRLSDSAGRVLAWNDDHKLADVGWLTHHADSWLSATLPADGAYRVTVSDAQRHGGPAFSYRLRVSAPRPDFVVLSTPSGVPLPPGPAAALKAHVLRIDGFDGDVEVQLAGTPPGFRLSGGRVPRGRGSVRMTLHAPAGPIDPAVALRLEARALIGGRTVVRQVVPADEATQAFLPRHIVPCGSVLAAGRGPRPVARSVELAADAPVRIPAGGTAAVLVRARAGPMLRQAVFELDDPPKGLSLESVTQVPQGLSIVLRADATQPAPGLADNLMVEVLGERPTPAKKGGRPDAKRRLSLGFLPAIPFEVVAPDPGARR